ncbi:MAG: metallophosphoesterase [Paludibacter sp.]
MKNKTVYICLYLILFQIFSAVYAAKPFRIAFFTDLHISSSNPLPTEDLQNAVDEVNKTSGLDFVLVSGDVTQIGDTESLKLAKQMLDKLKIPYYVTAGNHEYKINSANDSNFIKVFGDDKFSFVHNDVRFIGFTIKPIPKIGIGHISKQNITWMKTMLKSNGKKIPVFVVTHYPVQNGDVVNWSGMMNLFKKNNVKAVLGGHYHRNVVFNYDGIPGIIHRSTLRGKEKLGGYSILSISDSIKVFEKKIGQPLQEWLALPVAK